MPTRPPRRLRLVAGRTESAMSLRVAFASSDRVVVDQHFGAASAFAIHAIDADSSALVEVAEFIETAMDGHEGKLAAKIELLAGCAAVYCQAVGASAVQQLLAKGIQPIKVPDGTTIDALIGVLQQELRAGPVGWIAKALARGRARDERRFDAMAEEGWQE
jgi:nitrogen fixation protein NifX